MTTLRRATADDARELTAVYLASRRHALPGLKEAHTEAEVLAWVTHQLLSQSVVPSLPALRHEPTTVVWVALDAAGELVGFSARKDDWLEQLYVRPQTLRQGVGTQLLSLAKAESPEVLSLYTFQRNSGARAFYERHGFELVLTRDGTSNEEQEPDVLYRWRR